MRFTGTAPGKLILAGEHAVVEGHWAIAAALPRLTTVTLTPRAGPTALSDSPDDRLETQDPRLLPALLTVVPGDGYTIGIRSDLPIGCGLGSSAALAIATLRALAAAEGRTPGFSELHARGFEVERAFHGTPSGVDHAVSALGGVVRYRRPVGSAPELEPLTPARPLTLVVANTGRPAATTAEMVQRVRERGSRAELAAIGALVEQVHVAVRDGAPQAGLGELFDRNHELLQAIGVSTPGLDRACDVLRQAGAYGAKLAGAGGGGVAFGLFAPDRAGPALDALARVGFPGFVVTIP